MTRQPGPPFPGGMDHSPSLPSAPFWKEALLRSSLPLEFEAVRHLTAAGFSVNADLGASADGGVDIHARIPLFPDESPGAQGGPGVLELLVACAHRSPEAQALFLPHPDPHGMDMASPGRALRVVDHFSPFVVAPEEIDSFDEETPLCARGLELDPSTRMVDEDFFRHVIRKLQAPLPRLMADNIVAALTGPEEANLPFLFCPVLLTTAPPRVLKSGAGLEDIVAASHLEDVTDPAPRLVLISDLGADFQSRRRTEMNRLAVLTRGEKIQKIEMKKARYYNSRFHLPLTLMDSLMEGQYVTLSRFFSRFVVCHRNDFASLVDRMVRTARRALSTSLVLD